MTRKSESGTFPAQKLTVSNVWTGKSHAPDAGFYQAKEKRLGAASVVLKTNPKLKGARQSSSLVSRVKARLEQLRRS
jgi:hypothetical protein